MDDTPVLIAVKADDLLRVVYYTSAQCFWFQNFNPSPETENPLACRLKRGERQIQGKPPFRIRLSIIYYLIANMVAKIPAEYR